MPDAESFIAAIAANPPDDLPRLVYADWLDENGDPARAAFIRDHVALAKLRPGTDEYKTLFRRCADTLKANLPAWIQPACDAFGQPAEWKPGKAAQTLLRLSLVPGPGPGQKIGLRGFCFGRGLVEWAELDFNMIRQSAPLGTLLTHHPITSLSVSYTPPYQSKKWDDVFTARLRQVRSLKIGGVPQLATFFARPEWEGLAHLSVGGGGVGDLGKSPLAKRITSLRTTPSLDTFAALADFPLDDRLQELGLTAGTGVLQTGARFWPPLSRVAFRPTLKRLDLTRCGMTDDGLAAFARGEEWVRLQGLKLGGNLFGDRGWADFCRGWRTPELTYLDASRNRLTDAGAEMLSRSGMLKTLRVIDLRGNRIAGRGAVALARAVAEGKVNRLLLAGNPLGKREAAMVKGLLGERSDI